MKALKLTLVAFGITLALLVLLVVFAVLTSLLAHLITLIPGLGWIEHWMILPAAILFWTLLPKRYKVWHRPYDIRSTVVIDVPAHAVWARILPRPGQRYFLSSVAAINAVQGQADCVDMVFEPKLSDTPQPPLRARIEESETAAYLRLSYDNAKDFPLWAGDLVTTEYYLEHLGDQTRVTMIERLDKLRPSTIASLLFLNPCRDALARLAALCEGRADPSWMGRMTAGAVADNGSGNELTQATTFVGLMVCAMITLFGIGLVFFILQVVAPS